MELRKTAFARFIYVANRSQRVGSEAGEVGFSNAKLQKMVVSGGNYAGTLVYPKRQSY